MASRKHDKGYKLLEKFGDLGDKSALAGVQGKGKPGGGGGQRVFSKPEEIAPRP
jgi:hypothetical protein